MVHTCKAMNQPDCDMAAICPDPKLFLLTPMEDFPSLSMDIPPGIFIDIRVALCASSSVSVTAFLILDVLKVIGSQGIQYSIIQCIRTIST